MEAEVTRAGHRFVRSAITGFGLGAEAEHRVCGKRGACGNLTLHNPQVPVPARVGQFRAGAVRARVRHRSATTPAS